MVESELEPGVGFEYPRTEVSWLKRDVLLFANTIGCKADELHFLYENHPNFQVFPTYPVILSFKTNTQELTNFYAESQEAYPVPGIPALDPSKVVDGSRHLKIYKPLPTTSTSRSFFMRKQVQGVYDKGAKGTVVQTQQSLIETLPNNADEVIYATITISSFYLSHEKGSWSGPRGPSLSPPKMPDAKPIWVEDFETTKETALLYRLNGDYNPLHATPEPGEALGYGGVILHGLIAWNFAARAILRRFCGSDATGMREFGGSFKGVVKGGDGLVLRVWRSDGEGNGWEELVFEVLVRGTERVAISGGRAVVRCVREEVKTEGDTMVGVQSRL